MFVVGETNTATLTSCSVSLKHIDADGQAEVLVLLYEEQMGPPPVC